MTAQIVVLDPMTEQRAALFRSFMPPGFAMTHATARGDEHLKSIIAEADFAISGQTAVSGDVLRAARRLKLLHKWGVGVDNFDLDAARACDIKVARTTGANALPVAETTLGLILSLIRNIANGQDHLRRGDWAGSRGQDSFMLSGRTVGIVGLGYIGKALVRLLAGFGCRILYYKPARLDVMEETKLGIHHASLPDLLAQSDVVTLHCPLTPETRGMIDRRALETMKRTAILINVARGELVVEQDLVEALETRVILGAATDVYPVEPLPADSRLPHIPNLIATPHLAALAADNFAKTVQQMFANILAVQEGRPINPVDVVAA